MTPIHEYLLSGLLPEDPKESRKIRIKAPQYKLIKGSLYKKSFYTPWLRCIAPPKTNDVIKQIHKDCEKCKEQYVVKKIAEIRAITAGNAWLFSHWGVNILGPISTASGGLKFLAVAIEHSTKWIEAKPLTTRKNEGSDKKKERKEVASIEKAYYQNKLRRYHSKRNSPSNCKVRDSVLLLQNNTENPQGFTTEASAGGDIGLETRAEDEVAL
ncbi:reverse transcriptase domain-containing protein [Tanacetum coccineum]|uniref:Reverse transcriptase domain-containing protein n=1 Tax=Tanacetum coccineum TaxID=301880 RepID=A0ABQ5IF34_9ASTR